ncbi:UNVERIFIED_CONTAM: Retrovirus-related Pol polyprotein from transposon TNT 1-94 [Sesamum calycinum]|uniref:Retrovirus-related Pol polyprotein from transposon TNT 1-94 n=1 Tax=Sesamum calycinum TaxID=2727403 RepID=A0AAW2IZD0_9LAMI
MKDGSSHLLDVYGPLNTKTRGGFSYFITFTDDHSRYGYVYLKRYKSEAFVRFKEFRLEVENQTGRKIKIFDQTEGYALETAARLLNIVPSKTMAQTPYQIWYGKPASYKFIGYPKETAGYYFYDPSEQKVFVSRNAVFLERGFQWIPDSMNCSWRNQVRSARVPQPSERYGFLGMTSQLDNDPKTYREEISDIDSEKLLEAMKFEIDSMSSNQVWTLVDRPKGVRSVGCKWVYKRKIRADGEMDVKTAFLNGFVEEEIYMDQSEGLTVVGEEQKVCHFQRSIYGLKQSSEAGTYVLMKSYGASGRSVVFLVLYMDDILLIGNNIKMLGDTKAWLSTQFSMKDWVRRPTSLGSKSLGIDLKGY